MEAYEAYWCPDDSGNIVCCVVCHDPKHSLFQDAAFYMQTALDICGEAAESHVRRKCNVIETTSRLAPIDTNGYQHLMVGTVLQGAHCGLQAIGIGGNKVKLIRACNLALAIAVANGEQIRGKKIADGLESLLNIVVHPALLHEGVPKPPPYPPPIATLPAAIAMPSQQLLCSLPSTSSAYAPQPPPPPPPIVTGAPWLATEGHWVFVPQTSEYTPSTTDSQVPDQTFGEATHAIPLPKWAVPAAPVPTQEVCKLHKPADKAQDMQIDEEGLLWDLACHLGSVQASQADTPEVQVDHAKKRLIRYRHCHPCLSDEQRHMVRSLIRDPLSDGQIGAFGVDGTQIVADLKTVIKLDHWKNQSNGHVWVGAWLDWKAPMNIPGLKLSDFDEGKTEKKRQDNFRWYFGCSCEAPLQCDKSTHCTTDPAPPELHEPAVSSTDLAAPSACQEKRGPSHPCERCKRSISGDEHWTQTKWGKWVWMCPQCQTYWHPRE